MTRRCVLLVLCLLAVPAALVTTATQTPRVQIGYCVPLKDLELAKTAGFDYAELRTTEVAALSDAEMDQALLRARTISLPTPVANLFLPATLKLTGPAANPDEQLAYVKKALPRMARFGVSIIVFGSGGARNFPEGFDKELAFQQLVAFGKRVAPEARAVGITIAVEPLRRQESNIINTAREGLRLVAAIDDPAFQLMIDFYHLASESEDPQIVIEAKDHIRHLHMANPTGRVFPLKWEEFNYDPFFQNLRTIGYAGRMSIEASSPSVATEGPVAIALLRKALAP